MKHFRYHCYVIVHIIRKKNFNTFFWKSSYQKSPRGPNFELFYIFLPHLVQIYIKLTWKKYTGMYGSSFPFWGWSFERSVIGSKLRLGETSVKIFIDPFGMAIGQKVLLKGHWKSPWVLEKLWIDNINWKTKTFIKTNTIFRDKNI